MAIATELRQLIDYHNVRVYRLEGSELVPVAMQGQVGEYVDETPDQLRVAVGEGITGWVAEHGIAAEPRRRRRRPARRHHPRHRGRPRRVDAPRADDLRGPGPRRPRALEARPRPVHRRRPPAPRHLRQLRGAGDGQRRRDRASCASSRRRSSARSASQRELLQITESILTTLDGRVVLESITDRLGGLVACDNIAIEVVDPATGLLTPADRPGRARRRTTSLPWEPGETGIATWVVDHNEPAYVDDERHDPRVNHFRERGHPGRQPGRRAAARPRRRHRRPDDRAARASGNAFTDDEFELVQLFAAQVSIALQNAEVFQAVELRAQTDDLTGLLNHGTFEDRLERERSTRAQPFSLIMLDLDDFRDVNNRLGHQAGDQAAARDRDRTGARRSRHRPDLPLRRRRVHVPAARHRRRRRHGSSRSARPTRSAPSGGGITAPRSGSPPTRRWRRPPPRSSSPPTGPASSPSAAAVTGSPPRPRAWRSPPSSRSRSRPRSTRPGND